MAHITGTDRSKTLLMPERVEDYVSADNPVRFIDAFVDGLDLTSAGFQRVKPEATGRPGFDPADLLKLYIYGYLNRVRSSRRLEAEAMRNIEVIWLLRQLTPDYKTIADFRRDNRAAFKKVFREFIVLCRGLNLFGRELLAVDGTKLKAVNSKDRNFTKNGLIKAIKLADKRLAAYLKQLDDGDDGEDGTPPPGRDDKLVEKMTALKERQDRNKALLTKMEKAGEKQISLTDPDSQLMKCGSQKFVGYNAQIAVDCKHKLIVEHDVTNHGADVGLLAPTAVPAVKLLDVEKIDVVADRGYYKIEDIEACEAGGLVPYVAKPQRGYAVRKGFFTKDDFLYDAVADQYVCPAGQRLSPLSASKSRENTKLLYYNRKACKSCDIRAKCTDSKMGARHVSRLENEAIMDRMAERLKARPEIMDQRRESVEHPFGSIKQWMNQGAFLMRGLEKVRAEFSLTALAYNLRRVLNLVDFDDLMAAVKG